MDHTDGINRCLELTGGRTLRDCDGTTRKLERVPYLNGEAPDGADCTRATVLPFFIRRREHVELRNNTSDAGDVARQTRDSAMASVSMY